MDRIDVPITDENANTDIKLAKLLRTQFKEASVQIPSYQLSLLKMNSVGSKLNAVLIIPKGSRVRFFVLTISRMNLA